MGLAKYVRARKEMQMKFQQCWKWKKKKKKKKDSFSSGVQKLQILLCPFKSSEECY